MSHVVPERPVAAPEIVEQRPVVQTVAQTVAHVEARSGERVPYVAAVVDLAEGPRMMTNVVECAFDALEMGMALEAVFHPTSDEFTIVQFKPAA